LAGALPLLENRKIMTQHRDPKRSSTQRQQASYYPSKECVDLRRWSNTGAAIIGRASAERNFF
jgi:hypothetical protein